MYRRHNSNSTIISNLDKNKKRITEQQKKYNEGRSDELKKYKKDYYEKNKEIISKKGKEYREKNKKKIKERESQKVQCECGSIVSRGNMWGHKKTKKHILYINSINN